METEGEEKKRDKEERKKGMAESGKRKKTIFFLEIDKRMKTKQRRR